MAELHRKSVRLLSSLRDLKLGPNGKPAYEVTFPVMQNKMRSVKKIMAIKRQDDDETIYEQFTRLEKKATANDYKLIRQCLSTHFVFSSIVKDPQITDFLLKNFFCCQVKAGQEIMKQGDEASSFFVLQSGKFAVFINGQYKKDIKSGDGFGELALLYSAPRSATLKALENCTLWGIDRTTFKKVIAEASQAQFEDSRKFIEKVKFFEYLTTQQKDAIATQLIMQRHEKGEKVVHEGDPADCFFIVKSGCLKNVEGGKETSKIEPGDYFGQNALLSETGLRRSTVVAEEESVLFALGRDCLTQLLGKNLQTVVVRNKIMSVLTSSNLFNQLAKLQLERIIDCLQIQKIPEKAIAIKNGDFCRERLFFILQGTPMKDHNDGTDIKNLFYGEKSMLLDFSKLKYTFNLRFPEGGIIAWANYQAICGALHGTFEEAVSRQKSMKNKTKQDTDTITTLKNNIGKLSLDNFLVVKNLGHGQFGNVFLVTTEARKDFYALKCIQKTMILNMKLEKHLQNQKTVLQQINHPFLINCGRSFKDSHHVYFLTEHINGMELFDVIRDIGLLNSKHTSLYIGTMLMALEYLHKNNIIYRDLKPENIMVDHEGYLKLIDMGTCKIMSTKAVMPKTFTIIGTPHYMAPEVLSGKGYTYYADLWSLGVCMYQFLIGNLPFGEEAEDPYEIYEQIIKKQIIFAHYVSDDKAKALIRKLLSKVAESRLGESYNSLYNHPWFANMEWDMLLSKKLKMPYLIPQEKLVNVGALSSTSKRLPRLHEELSRLGSTNKKLTRKDFQPDWDKIF